MEREKQIIRKRRGETTGAVLARGRKKPRPRQQPVYDKPFRFFDLPAELRNLVYSFFAADETACINKHGNVASSSSLQEASPATAVEYPPILLLCAKSIAMDVHNFDFRHVVTFINRLSAVELQALPNINQASTRSIKVTLSFDYTIDYPDDYLLNRWLNRAGSTTKRGTALDITYLSYVSPDRTIGYQWYSKGSRWARVLNSAVVTKRGRAKVEAEKIRMAWSGPLS